MHKKWRCWSRKGKGGGCIRKVEKTTGGIPEHMRGVAEEANEGLSTGQVEKMTEMLTSFGEVFAKDDTDLVAFTTIRHKINTGDARPIKQKVRRTPLGYADEEKAHLEGLLKANVIEPSNSEWASPSCW